MTNYKSYCFGVFIVLVLVDDLVGTTGLDVAEYETFGCIFPLLADFGAPLVGLVGILPVAVVAEGDDDDAIVAFVVVTVVDVTVEIVTVGLVVLPTAGTLGLGGSVTDCTLPSVSVTGICQEIFIC